MSLSQKSVNREKTAVILACPESYFRTGLSVNTCLKKDSRQRFACGNDILCIFVD